MNKILDKLGIYDLVAVLLSGICIFTFTDLVLQMGYNISIDTILPEDTTLLFLVISYFLGLIFQETGSFVQKEVTHKHNKILKRALNTSDDSHIYMTEIEKRGVEFYVIEKLKLNVNEDNDNIIYNYCKFFFLENEDTSRIDRDQSLSAMSRSLSLFFMLIAVLVFFDTLFIASTIKYVLIFISVFLAVLFYRRWIRFAVLRYTNIIRTFYYKVVIK